MDARLEKDCQFLSLNNGTSGELDKLYQDMFDESNLLQQLFAAREQWYAKFSFEAYLDVLGIPEDQQSITAFPPLAKSVADVPINQAIKLMQASYLQHRKAFTEKVKELSAFLELEAPDFGKDDK